MSSFYSLKLEERRRGGQGAASTGTGAFLSVLLTTLYASERMWSSCFTDTNTTVLSICQHLPFPLYTQQTHTQSHRLPEPSRCTRDVTTFSHFTDVKLHRMLRICGLDIFLGYRFCICFWFCVFFAKDVCSSEKKGKKVLKDDGWSSYCSYRWYTLPCYVGGVLVEKCGFIYMRLHQTSSLQ